MTTLPMATTSTLTTVTATTPATAATGDTAATMSRTSFDTLATVVRRASGIVLDQSKMYLLTSRLDDLRLEHRCASWDDFAIRVAREPDGVLAGRVVEAMTTNETSWFRDVTPFDALRQHIVPQLAQVPGRVSIWSAACSTGQEPYSIAMTLLMHAPSVAARTAILATDLSEDVLRRAREGRYRAFEMDRGLPPTAAPSFERDGDAVVVKPAVRALVEFRRHNLVAPWPGLARHHLVFMRNVLIYFDLTTKREVLGRVRQVLAPGGILVLGASETAYGIDDRYERVQLGDLSAYRLIA